MYQNLPENDKTEVTTDDSLKRKRGDEEPTDQTKKARTDEVQASVTQPKKKKEYVAKSTFVADDEFEDILVSGWFYLDTTGQQQGPFTTRDMKEWYIAGFFTDEMLVTRVNLGEWKTVASCPEFKNLDRRPADQAFMMMMASAEFQADDGRPNPYYRTDLPAYDPEDYADPGGAEAYAQAMLFNSTTGRMGGEMYWASKGLPADKDGRMLAQFMDMDDYQEKMRLAAEKAAEEGTQRKKITKGMVKAFKKKKEDKRRRRILMM